jgi:hypothetical protein
LGPPPIPPQITVKSQDQIRWLLRILSLIGLATGIFLTLEGDLRIDPLGGMSSVSLAAVSGLYLLTELHLSRNGTPIGQAVVLAILFANAFLQAYEITYHFTFPVYLNYFRFPFLNGDGIRFLFLDGIMLLPLVLIKKYLSLTRLTWLLLVIFLLVWGAWILYGFPQYFAEGYYFPRLLETSDPFHTSLYLNFGSKALLACFFASFLWGDYYSRHRRSI